MSTTNGAFASQARWALVSGARGGPKIAMVQAVLDELRARGRRVAGFRQVRGMAEGQELERLAATGAPQRRVVSRVPGTPREGEELFCSRIFTVSAFDEARAWLEADGPGGDVWVLDEVSKLEAARKGHHRAVTWALEHAGARPVIIGVRQEQLFDVMTALGLEHAPVASLEGAASPADVRAFVDAL